jgi:hypothetical protein
LYLNGYIGPLATSGGLVSFMRVQLGKPIPSPVVLGQVTERFRDAVKTRAEQEQIPMTSSITKNGRTMSPTKYGNSAGYATGSFL